mmetsp:Transcript_6543/g.11506  ORF Transcript_6543/g.11506 Transcript_6543/m.11506 type:complete len:371 (-) Transcript_6543:6897-8009(-)
MGWSECSDWLLLIVSCFVVFCCCFVEMFAAFIKLTKAASAKDGAFSEEDIEDIRKVLEVDDPNVALNVLRPGVLRCAFGTREGCFNAIDRVHQKMTIQNKLLHMYPDRVLEKSKKRRRECNDHEDPGWSPGKIFEGEHPIVKGLYVFADFISPEEEQNILTRLTQQKWEPEKEGRQPKNRRVQHFGYKFDYGTRRCDPNDPIGDLPDWLDGVTQRVNMETSKLVGFQWKADQITVNEYIPGQGIPPHVDTHSAFEDGIVSLSTGCGTVMQFAKSGDKSIGQQHIYVPRRSLLVMSGPSRYLYTHGIQQRKTDPVEGRGVVVRDSPRLSVTFRHIKLSPECSCEYEEMCDLSRLQKDKLKMRWTVDSNSTC